MVSILNDIDYHIIIILSIIMIW